VSDPLWDPRAPADPDLARLERALSPLRHRGAVPALPPRRAPRRWPLAAAGAALACAAALGVWWWRREPAPQPVADPCAAAAPGDGFKLEVTAGAPACGGAITAGGVLPVGTWLETDADDAARIEVADIGTVAVAGDSKVAVLATSAAEHRMSLERGALHARVTAPPRLFVVETPEATAIDLGCEYDLEVAADGSGSLRVQSGIVELAAGRRLVVVPMGASAKIRPGLGPSTPWASNAAEPLRQAIERWDRGDASALAEIVATATAYDTVTLWNLLGQVDAADERGAVHDAITALVEVPEWVLRDRVIAGDPTALEDLRESLEHYWFFPETLEEEPTEWE
jgi:ferric-dicitrate binding protein FerR (iron transport regulator)